MMGSAASLEEIPNLGTLFNEQRYPAYCLNIVHRLPLFPHFLYSEKYNITLKEYKTGGNAMTRRIIISTESGADLPEDLRLKYNIQVVPMHVIMDGKDYLDGTLPVQEIYDFYARNQKIPSTTSTNSHEYHDFFTKINNDFPDCMIVHIGYTSKASSSFQNAVLASEAFANLYLIDALNVTGGLTAIVMYAVRLIEQEPTIAPEAILEKIKAIIPKTRLAFIPGSLDFLKAGGRVSNLAYLGGTFLQLKPRIELVDGILLSSKKYRGKMEKVSEKLMRDYFSEYDMDRNQLYLIYSVGLHEAIKERASDIAIEYGFNHVKWMQAGAVISTHSGPGGFGIAGIEI